VPDLTVMTDGPGWECQPPCLRGVILMDVT